MRRELTGYSKMIVRCIALALGFFHLYTAATMPLPTVQQRSVHVGLGIALTLLLFSPRKNENETKVPLYDLFLSGIILFACLNAFLNMDRFLDDMMSTTPLDLFLSAATMLICIEGARRVTGWVFPVLVIIFLVYALLGNYIPGSLGHSGVRWDLLLMQQYQTTYGLWGNITGISATIIAMFLIFGAFILHCGAGSNFIDMALAIVGKLKGGPALVAVVSSALFGMISGSAVANTATTGNLTIPLMKRLGYNSAFAGGVEATASSGGQLTPPIMGAGAFLMAEFLGISYLEVAIAAAIPAFLFYTALFSGVLFEAYRADLASLPKEMIPRARSILTWPSLGPLVIPMGLLFFLIVMGASITRACFLACIVELVIYVFINLRWHDILKRVRNLVNILEFGGKAIVEVVALLVSANIVIGILSQTGLSVKITGAILEIGGRNIWGALIGSSVTCLVLGMGLPTTAAYVLGAAILAPAVIKLGIAPIVAHFFVFYYCILSVLTPPVCLGVYTAAGIARAPWLETAWHAMRLGFVLYMIPYILIMEPMLLIQKNISIALVWPTITAIVGATLFASAIIGWLRRPLPFICRLLIFFGAGLLFIPERNTDIIGMALSIGGILAAQGGRLAKDNR
jgi:TRAP transporter 4TM/12TM fusion protein